MGSKGVDGRGEFVLEGRRGKLKVRKMAFSIRSPFPDKWAHTGRTFLLFGCLLTSQLTC
jgi:hypothetical protein